MNHRDLENGMEEQGKDVSELLGALPRVEAPANFEFGVKARIASGVKPRSPIFPFLKVAAPLTFVLLVGALVIFYGMLPGNEGEVVGADLPVSQNIPTEREQARTADAQDKDSKEPSLNAVPASEDLEDALVATSSSQTPKNTTVRRVPNSASRRENEPGSKDFGLQDATIIQPPGIGTGQDTEVAVRDLLEMLGMKVASIRGGWKVVSTTSNSLAAKSGVLANDVVESIDGQTIAGKDKLSGKVEGKALTVRRDGKAIRLELKN